MTGELITERLIWGFNSSRIRFQHHHSGEGWKQEGIGNRAGSLELTAHIVNYKQRVNSEV